jgi:hypothetical protein
MNPIKSFFFKSGPFELGINLFGTTSEGVTPCALARLGGPTCARLMTWRHVAPSRAVCCGVTELHRLLWRYC